MTRFNGRKVALSGQPDADGEALSLEIEALATRYRREQASVDAGIQRQTEAALLVQSRRDELFSYRSWLEATHRVRDEELGDLWRAGDIQRPAGELPVNEEIDRRFESAAHFATLGGFEPNLPHHRGAQRWIRQKVGRWVLALAKVFTPHQTRFNHRSLLLADSLRRELEHLRKEVIELRLSHAQSELEHSERESEAALRRSGLEDHVDQALERQMRLGERVAELQETVDDLPPLREDLDLGHRRLGTDLAALRARLSATPPGDDGASVARRLESYLPLFEGAGSGWPVLDLGDGGGDWLEGLDGAGIPGRGLPVHLGHPGRGATEAVPGLATLAAGSFRAVTAFRLIERLDLASVVGVLEESLRILKPGGYLVIETPDPANLEVATDAWAFGEVTPVPSPALEILVTEVGFVDVRIEPVVCKDPDGFDGDGVWSSKGPGGATASEWLEQRLRRPKRYALIAQAPSIEGATHSDA